MILFRALALLHDAVQAVRDHVRVTVNFGEAYAPEDRGIAVTAWGVHVQADTDGLMVLRTGAVQSDDSDECVHGPDDPQNQVWVVRPTAIRGWLEAIRDGRDVDDLMTELELAEVGEGVA